MGTRRTEAPPGRQAVAAHEDDGDGVDQRELLKRIRKIEIVTTRKVNEQLAGQYHSVFKGRGMSFDEVRPYQPGDEIRHMDWRVTARSGKPHTKLFEEEREQGLLLALDCNPGMRFGTRVRFKSVQAARAGALLAWMASAAGDRVGGSAIGAAG